MVRTTGMLVVKTFKISVSVFKISVFSVQEQRFSVQDQCFSIPDQAKDLSRCHHSSGSADISNGSFLHSQF
jgi:hypothetical protein